MTCLPKVTPTNQKCHLMTKKLWYVKLLCKYLRIILLSNLNCLILQIVQESHKRTTGFNGKFIIDDTLGRDVKFTLEILDDSYGTVSVKYIHSNGTIIDTDFPKDTTFIKPFPYLEVLMHACALNKLYPYSMF